MACNGQTVYTVIVNLGSLEFQAVAREINKDNFDNVAYAPAVEPSSPFNSSDGDYEGIINGDNEGEAKQASVGDNEGEASQAYVARSLKYSNDKDYNDNVDVDSD